MVPDVSYTEKTRGEINFILKHSFIFISFMILRIFRVHLRIMRMFVHVIRRLLSCRGRRFFCVCFVFVFF